MFSLHNSQRVATLSSKSKTFPSKECKSRSFLFSCPENKYYSAWKTQSRVNTHSDRRENSIERKQKHCQCDKKARQVQGVWFLVKLVRKKEKLQIAPNRLSYVENHNNNIKLSDGMSWKRCETESVRENININITNIQHYRAQSTEREKAQVSISRVNLISLVFFCVVIVLGSCGLG